jgi:hypothetical protein
MSSAVLSDRRLLPALAGRRPRPFVAVAAIAALATIVYFVFVAPIHQVDLQVFLKAGGDVLHGRDPYSSTESETIRTNAAFVYPVAVAWWFAPLSVLGSASHVVYAVASLIAIAVACWWARPGQPMITALVLLSSCAVIGLQDGSVNPWLLLGLIAAWRWRDRPVVCGLGVAALIVCKLFLWPVFGWLLLSRRYRAAGVSAVVAGVTLVAGWVFGPLGTHGYATMLHVLSGLEAPHTAGLSGLLIHWHASLNVATVLATALALLVLGATGWRLRRRGIGAECEQLVFGGAVVAALLASPIVWHHYYLLLAAPLLVASRSIWPYILLSFASWAAAAPHPSTSGHTAVGYVLGLGGISLIALVAGLHAWRHPAASDRPVVARVRAAAGAAKPVAAVAALAVLVVVGMSALERVSVSGGWGALVTLVETAGVLAYVWSKRSEAPQAEPLRSGLKSGVV